MKNRVQLSSDALRAYRDCVEKAFGCEVDYGQIVKIFAQSDVEAQRRYSPPQVISVTRNPIAGNPDKSRICTSHAQAILRSKTIPWRMHFRRLSRLTNAFSKKLENFKAAVALNFALLQFRQDSRLYPLHSCDGSRCHGFNLDSQRSS